jgi:hypothetical protein
VDGSIWVTSGGVNPTATIQALVPLHRGQHKAAPRHTVRLNRSGHSPRRLRAAASSCRDPIAKLQLELATHPRLPDPPSRRLRVYAFDPTVLFWSRATRDLLKSFGWGIAALHRLMQRRSCPLFAARPIGSLSPAGRNKRSRRRADRFWLSRAGRLAAAEKKVRSAPDSTLEEDGFELAVSSRTERL